MDPLLRGASYASANSAAALDAKKVAQHSSAVERGRTGALPPGGPPDVPPGLTGVFGGHRGPGDFSAMSGPPKPGPDSVTAFPEAMRNLELPALPAPSAENAAPLFGDWMTIITPLMGDLSASSKSSKEFWELIQEEVSVKYNEWLVASPLARLRMKVEDQVPVRFQRMDQRASSTLLASLPDAVRREIVASRKVATAAILYKLYTIYQPGGGAERSNLLRSHSASHLANVAQPG